MAAVQVLFVCTANICRSPVAEGLARHRSPGTSRSTFASAGFRRAGVPCPAPMVREAATRGVDLSDHRSRTVDRATLDAADLVVTMEARHVLEIAVLSRAAFAKTVPLRELARMLADGPLTLHEVLDRLAQRDPNHYLTVGSADDVPDPYRRNGRAHRAAVDLIDSLVATVIDNLRLDPDAAGGGDDVLVAERVAAADGVVPPRQERRVGPELSAVRPSTPSGTGRAVVLVRPIAARPATLPAQQPGRRLRRHRFGTGHLVAAALVVLVVLWAGLSGLCLAEAERHLDAGEALLRPLPAADLATIDADAVLADLDAARRHHWTAERYLENPVLLPLRPVPGVGDEVHDRRAAVRRFEIATRGVVEAVEEVVAVADDPVARGRALAGLRQALDRLGRALGPQVTDGGSA